MNLEEGFRRIGIATYWVAIMLGIIAFFATRSLALGVLLGVLVALVVIILFHIAIYVMKGFIKQSDEGKDKD